MRPMDVRLIEARTHGRVIIRAADPRHLLVGFHGYAQNAEETDRGAGTDSGRGVVDARRRCRGCIGSTARGVRSSSPAG